MSLRSRSGSGTRSCARQSTRVPASRSVTRPTPRWPRCSPATAPTVASGYVTRRSAAERRFIDGHDTLGAPAAPFGGTSHNVRLPRRSGRTMPASTTSRRSQPNRSSWSTVRVVVSTCAGPTSSCCSGTCSGLVTAQACRVCNVELLGRFADRADRVRAGPGLQWSADTGASRQRGGL